MRSLRCGPGLKRLPGRTPGGGDFCARGPSRVTFSTSSFGSSTTVFGRWCAVVESRRQLHGYRQLLMTVPRSEQAVPAPLRSANAFAHGDR